MTNLNSYSRYRIQWNMHHYDGLLAPLVSVVALSFARFTSAHPMVYDATPAPAFCVSYLQFDGESNSNNSLPEPKEYQGALPMDSLLRQRLSKSSTVIMICNSIIIQGVLITNPVEMSDAHTYMQTRASK
uniref:Uncharacterized protein n=1 Tax=Glossina pallidipes TaxID=7398 RepID=A0A1A9Z9K4_GLOPL